jgi:hypothetical protein
MVLPEAVCRECARPVFGLERQQTHEISRILAESHPWAKQAVPVADRACFKMEQWLRALSMAARPDGVARL